MGVGRALALAGLGRGISQAGATLSRVRRQRAEDAERDEDRELRRINVMSDIGQVGGIIGNLDDRYYNPDGTPKSANGSGSIGGSIGSSSASTQQPYESEHVPMRSVGTYRNQQVWMPADGMTPATRVTARSKRAEAAQETQAQAARYEALSSHPDTKDLPEPVRRAASLDETATRELITPRNVYRDEIERRRAANTMPTVGELNSVGNAGRADQRLANTEQNSARAALSGEITNARGALGDARTDANQAFSRKPEPKDYPGYRPSLGRFNTADSTTYQRDLQNWQRDTASANQRVRDARRPVDSLGTEYSRQFGGGAAPAMPFEPATPAPAAPRPQAAGNPAQAAELEARKLAQRALAEGAPEADVAAAYQAAVARIQARYGVQVRPGNR